ncbi:MAG: hypothetical protein JWO53_399 [Chlamydiia bacterium]|nr:hypothetical protein [Chlamydiia bacterium]
MLLIIPRPLRDIIQAPIEMRKPKSILDVPGGSSAVVGINGDTAIVSKATPAEKMIKAMFRISLVALGVLALHYFPANIPMAAVLGSVISLPSVIVLSAGALVYAGGQAIVASMITGLFVSFAVGVSLTAVGWAGLECHDVVPFGLGEVAMDKFAKAYEAGLTKKLS